MEDTQLVVPVTEIRAIYELNPRTEDSYNPQNIDFMSLVQDIKENGVNEPIIVGYEFDEKQNSKYVIIAGFRRYSAASYLLEMLKKKNKKATFEVPIKVRPEVTEEKLQYEIISHQVRNRPFAPTEEGVAFQKLIDQGYTHKDVASKFNFGVMKIKKAISLLNFPDDFIPIINNPETLLGNAYTIAETLEKFNKKSDKKLRENLLELFRNNPKTSLTEFKKMMGGAIRDAQGGKKDLKEVAKAEKEEGKGEVNLLDKLRKARKNADANQKDGESKSNNADKSNKQKKVLLAKLSSPLKFRPIEEVVSKLKGFTMVGTHTTNVEFALSYILEMVSSEEEELVDILDNIGEDDEDIDLDEESEDEDDEFDGFDLG